MSPIHLYWSDYMDVIVSLYKLGDVTRGMFFTRNLVWTPNPVEVLHLPGRLYLRLYVYVSYVMPQRMTCLENTIPRNKEKHLILYEEGMSTSQRSFGTYRRCFCTSSMVDDNYSLVVSRRN